MKNTINTAIMILMTISLLAQERGMQPIVLKIEGKVIPLYRQSHALVIGTSNYSNGWSQLKGVESDIPAVAGALENNGFHVVTCLNPRDKSTIEKILDDFITKYGQEVESRLLFYFAMHGHTIKMPYGESMGYLCPPDVPNPNTHQALFISKALPMDAFEIYAKKIKSKHALFLFDACFAGQVFTSTRAAPEIIQYKTKDPVRQFITSGDADETVADKSIFRQLFVQALEGKADKGNDGYLTGSELGEYLQEQVVNLSKGTQHPQYGKIRNVYLNKGDFVFVMNHIPSTDGNTSSILNNEIHSVNENGKAKQNQGNIGREENFSPGWTGLQLEQLDIQSARELFGINAPLLRVKGVDNDSPAARAGIKPNDLITELVSPPADQNLSKRAFDQWERMVGKGETGTLNILRRLRNEDHAIMFNIENE